MVETHENSQKIKNHSAIVESVLASPTTKTINKTLALILNMRLMSK